MVLLAAVTGVRGQDPAPPAAPILASSARPRVPLDAARLWLVPAAGAAARLPQSAHDLAAAVRLHADGKDAEALAKLRAASEGPGELANYALYFTGVASGGLERFDEARRAFSRLRSRQPAGYLGEAAAIGEAEAAAALGDHQSALDLYSALAGQKTAAPDEVWLRVAQAAADAGDRERAAGAYLHLYYEFPLSDLASTVETELETLKDLPAVGDPSQRYTRELGRAERLFGARRYPEAQAAFTSIRSLASGADADLVALRLAECAFFLRRYREAREATRSFLEAPTWQAEALFFHLSSLRALGDTDGYIRLSHRLVEQFPDTPWAEDTLNNLATYYIVADEDEAADEVFREMSARFPRGRYAERAAWRTGWWAYRHDRFGEAARLFETLAAAFPRSDYRPACLYWSGKAYEKLGEPRTAAARYELAVTDYRNTYYGRLAATRLAASDARPASLVAVDRPEATLEAPPTASLIRTLLALELYDQALDEVLYAQRTWGQSPVTLATAAWIYNRQGDLRRGINTMKRAYPQYMATGGESLPIDLQKILYPLEYWKEIRQRAAAHELDPYLLAALVAQESTFMADARSSANAIGLMQVLPSTGRAYARKLRIRYSSSLLRRADANLRLGTAYLADLVRRFGGMHYALASYNAGENRVSAWIAERPGLERDEFIDDIPFPETQNYVKRVLGTAEDYRRLYGTPAAPSRSAPPVR